MKYGIQLLEDGNFIWYRSHGRSGKIVKFEINDAYWNIMNWNNNDTHKAIYIVKEIMKEDV